MTDSPVDLTICKRAIHGQGEVVRLEAKDGLRLILRLDISPADFLSAVMDGKTVVAAYSKDGAP